MPNFVRTIEGSLQYGNPVLMENVMESIDPVISPIKFAFAFPSPLV